MSCEQQTRYKYNSHTYKIHQGSRKGLYINIQGKKHYINQKGGSFENMVLKTPHISTNADFYDDEMMRLSIRPNSGEYFYNSRNVNSNGKVTRFFNAANYTKLHNNPVTRRNWLEENSKKNARMRLDLDNKNNDKSMNNAKYQGKKLFLLTRQEIINALENSMPNNLEVNQWYDTDDVDSNDFWFDVLKKYYNKNVLYLTPTLANSLLGKKFGVIMGQWWPTSAKDFSHINKIKNIREMRIILVDHAKILIEISEWNSRRVNTRLMRAIPKHEGHNFFIDDHGCNPIFVFKN